MKTNNHMEKQPKFIAVRDWTQPQVITPLGLPKVLAEARSAGYEAISMDHIRFPFGFRVVFRRATGHDFVHPFTQEKGDKAHAMKTSASDHVSARSHYSHQ